jgi:eukaryotic-like serine/threonine-protein kinase
VVEAGNIAGGRFRLINAIGKGGMGTVWRAHHEQIGRDVALKLSPSSGRCDHATRVQREAQIIGRFQHRNIVNILDAGEFEDEGCHFLAMELLHGRPFSDCFVRGKPLPPEDVLSILIDVCRGLEAAHAAGVVHRDIKPENIFLAEVPGEGTVPKILDFGISKTIDATITVDGQILGTPAYMSPEQARGSRDITPSADLWAIGVILYEALMGRQPFAGGDYRYLLLSIIEEAPEPLPDSVDAPLRAIVERCLQKDPAARYPTAAMLREDLERALEQRAGASVLRSPLSQRSLAPRSTLAYPLTLMPTTLIEHLAPEPPWPARTATSHRTSLYVFAVACLSISVAALFAAPEAPTVQLDASIARLARQRAASVQATAQDAGATRVAQVELEHLAPSAAPPALEPPTASPKAPVIARRRAFVTRINNPGF